MTLLLSLLLCAPGRVTIVANRPHPPSALSRVETALAAAWRRLYTKEDQQVAEGNALAAGGDPKSALKAYDAARARLHDDAALAFDRSAALLRLSDPSAAAEASSEAARAFERGEGALKAAAAYQRALAAESTGHPDDAMKLYGSALALDPDDVDSKVNLELLLRTEEQRKQQQAGQPQPAPRKKDQPQEKPDPAKGQSPQGEQKQAGNREQTKDKAQPQPGTDRQPKQDQKRPQQAEQKPQDRSEAERLLDALRASEKNLQMWRFAKNKSKEARRGEVEKDW